MAPETDSAYSTLLQALKSMHREVSKLISADDFPYQGGAYLTPSDIEDLKITFDPKASTEFWKSSSSHIRRALQDPLEKTFPDEEITRNEANECKKEFIESRCPTIEDAYTQSSGYKYLLRYVVRYGMFHNGLVDSSGDYLFQSLGVDFYRIHIRMETHWVFGTPGHPHITILSIQPQRALCPEELLYTEFWTLHHWSQKLFRRALDTTDLCLPMRLVSLCGYEARVVSAVFSLGYPRNVIIEGGHSKYHGVHCQIHVAEYRDLSIPQNFRYLMEELSATPCGSSNLEKSS